MRNTTGLYKHQRDNQGKRRKLPSSAKSATLVPINEYEYEKAKRMSDTPKTDAIAGTFFTAHHCPYEKLSMELERDLSMVIDRCEEVMDALREEGGEKDVAQWNNCISQCQAAIMALKVET